MNTKPKLIVTTAKGGETYRTRVPSSQAQKVAAATRKLDWVESVVIKDVR